MKTIILCLLIAGALAAPSGKPRFRRGLNKIVGGTAVSPGELPYQISFQDTSFGINFHFCGGSLYKEDWCICAGHCVDGEDYDNPSNLRIVAGDNDLSDEDGNEQASDVVKIILHEDYNSNTIENDISLLKINPISMNDFAQGVSLPEQGQDTTGDCVVSGWGTTSEGGSSPDVLQKVTVPVVSDEKCRDAYGQSDIADSMICAGVDEGGKDSCQGDSGGPLYCSGYLGGIVSWGYGCARPSYPGVYTEVAYFVDWIKANAV